MKKSTILLVLLLLLSVNAFSQKVAYAVLKDSTLTFYYGKKKPAGAYDVGKIIIQDHYDYKEWYGVSRQIKTVVFDKSFKDYRPKNCYKWFDNCENLTSVIGIKENLNTSEVTDMRYMFYDCSKLTSLDVSGFNTENVTNMRNMFSLCENLTSLDVSGFNTENVTDIRDMFSFCENLKTIYVGNGWNTINVTYSGYMFNKCPNLVGEKGTKYDENHLDAEYAHIDGGESNPGYLTKKTK